MRDEKVKVLQAIRPMTADEVARDTLRGQYRGYTTGSRCAARQPNRHVRRRETGSAKLALARRAVLFAQRQSHVVPHHANRHSISRTAAHVVFRRPRGIQGDANRLVIQVQPAEGIQLALSNQSSRCRHEAAADRFGFQLPARISAASCPRPISDCCSTRCTATPACLPAPTKSKPPGGIIDPILKAWKDRREPKLYLYEPGLWGPEESTEWMRSQGREWFDTCPVLQ